MSDMLLSLHDVHSGYSGAQVLFGVSLQVREGELVTLMGRNGMGKTTTLRVLFGLLPVQKGHIALRGREMTGAQAHRLAQAGLGYVPEGRQIFPRLTVEENLLATARPGPAGWTLERVYALFPRLKERRANLGTQLSGGEQQMLAIGRALMTNPALLVLDEATEGLAPVIRGEIWAALTALKAEGQSILVVDKNIAALTRIADRHVVMEKGHVVWSGTNAELLADRASVDAFLSL